MMSVSHRLSWRTLGGVLGFVCLAGLSACDGNPHDDLRSAARAVARQEGRAASLASQRLRAQGPSSLMHIEGAMHNAKPSGRVRLVSLMAKFDSVDSVALLAHWARRGHDEDVRDAALVSLQALARCASTAVAQVAKAALR